MKAKERDSKVHDKAEPVDSIDRRARNAGRACAEGVLLILAIVALGILAALPIRITPPSSIMPEAATVGAPPGYGLIDPSLLEPHGPIFIGDNASFTGSRGVRSGSGTPEDPYFITNWSIDLSNYPGASSGIWINDTDKYVVIENNKIINLNGASQWQGIQLGHFPYKVETKNVLIRHNEIRSRHAFGIAVREGSSDIRVESNLVKLEANHNWTYGLMTDRGVRNITFFGNFVDAHSISYLTVGIQIGDYRVTVDRRATDLRVERNTVSNATASGITADDVIRTVIRGNLIFNNYPGLNPIGAWPVRGIFIEERSNYTFVSENEIHTVERAIEIAAGLGTYFHNTIYDAVYGFFINDDGAFKEARWTTNNTVYDTTYWNITGRPFRLPAGGNHTVLDIGPGITFNDFSAIMMLANETPHQIRYFWRDFEFNISIALGTRLVYDRQLTSESQYLEASWEGDSLALNVLRFVPSNVSFALESSSDVRFDASGLTPLATYEVDKAGEYLSIQWSPPSGDLTFTLQASTYSRYSLRFVGFIAPPSVTILAPDNHSYVPSSVSVSWVVVDSGPGIQNLALAVDGQPSINVTGLANHTISGLTDGEHSIELTAFDKFGLNASQTASFLVDSTPPRLRITAPIDNSTVNTTSLLVTWDAADDGSGIVEIGIRLDAGGYYYLAEGDRFTIGGLSQGSHKLSIRVADALGLVTSAAVRFTVNLTSDGGGNEPLPNPEPTITSVVYVPDTSSLDIAFTEPMDQASVATALEVIPAVNYSLTWVNESRVRVLIEDRLENGTVYQLLLDDSARASSGLTLSSPFLFQFLASSPPAGSPISFSSPWFTEPAILLLLAANWAIAGFLIIYYRNHASELRSSLRQIRARYRGSLIIVFKRLARLPPETAGYVRMKHHGRGKTHRKRRTR